MTGTRQEGIKAADSAAPIQIISSEALKTVAGSPDLLTALSQIVPSFVMQAFGNDLAGETLQAKLRGLSPNDVLVLVNGKRRHTTANLEVDLGDPYQGGAGVDFNFIPLDAIDHIEVLTDGAAAQYGTDAIAGVINIILKKNPSGGSITGTYGNYMDGGGNTGDVSANAGFAPIENSYLNVTAEMHHHGDSNRGGVDPRVINAANSGTYPDDNVVNAPGYPYLNGQEGDAAYTLKIFSLNAGFDFGNGQELYAFGTYGDKRAAAYQNYRTPSKVSYTDPTTGVTTYPFPFGFDPQESTHETDYSVTGGFKGIVAGWRWDMSSTYGGDRPDIYTLNSANNGVYGTTGVPTPSNYYDGYLQTTQWTSTLDINRDFDVGLAGPLNVAYGAEYRRETYGIGAGVPISYEDGGAQSYPGFTPTDAGVHDRRNEAVYLDLAAKPIDPLRIDAAVRYEHYSDFGSATVGKLTARYDFTPEFAVRGTASNGFRAPTLAEEYYSATNVTSNTAFVQLPPNSAGGKLIGLGNGLQPEHSVNLSLGTVWRPTPGVLATLDIYQITITNRIVGTGDLYGTINGVPQPSAPAINAAIAANGNTLDPDVVKNGTTGVAIFANGIDTRTRGADLLFNFPNDYAFGHVNWSVGAEYNQTEITKVPGTPAQLVGLSLYNATSLSDVTTASPLYVVNLGAFWTWNKLSANLLEKIYGPSSEWENDDADNPGNLPEYFRTQIGVTAITDLDLGYQVTKNLKVDVGALNLFNRYPDKLNGVLRSHYDNLAYNDNLGVQQYPSFSPIGIDGGFYYVRAAFTF
ncbi:MAG TPA: TonB-dependent receptor [Steroidobacteraceae bacterium]|nr:TonB-dependent receptor [Steroidobacteraceae bacterium]